MFYLKSFITMFIFMFVFIFGVAQSKVVYSEEASETMGSDEPLYISAHTIDKDTLYLADNPTGHLLKETWGTSGTVPVSDAFDKPYIIMADPDRIAQFERERNDIVIHKQQKRRNE